MVCKFCNGPLKPLFISWFCPKCDENGNQALRNDKSHKPPIRGEDFFMYDEPTKVIDLSDYAYEDLDEVLEEMLSKEFDNDDENS